MILFVRILALFAAVVWCSACVFQMPSEATAPAETQPGEVALELAQGGSAVIVPVHINGQGPFRLILDTGATLTCVDADLAKKLGLTERAGIIGHGFGIGSQGQVGMVAIESLEVGSASAKDLTACTLDLKSFRGAGLQVDGLLGLNFLRDYRMTLDFERSVLVLDKG